MPRKLRWGLLSTARINQALIKPLHLSKRCELTAVASRDGERASQYAKEWDIPTSYGSYEELINDPEVDVIYNPLPNHLHAEWTVRACLAGKHVLCEKPIALSVDDVEQIQNAAEAACVVVMEAFMYRHHPQTQRVIKMVQSGEIGDLHYMRGAFSFTLNRKDDIRWDPGFGGGGLWDVGCYPISYFRAVTGGLPSSVQAIQQLTPSGVDGVMAVQLAYPQQIMAHMNCGIILPGYSSVEFHGSSASILVPNPFKPKERSEITVIKNGDQEVHRFRSSDLYLGEVENMADAVLEGKPALISLEESRQNIQTLSAILQSAQTGNEVHP